MTEPSMLSLAFSGAREDFALIDVKIPPAGARG
jgi:hypothetical protein